MTRRRKSMPFGFAILYLMVHFPFIWWWKIGITGTKVGTRKRAKQVDRAVFGFPIPVFFVPVFFAYQIEQWMHGMLQPIRVSFYKGDGHTEFFWFPAAVFALAVMFGIYWGYWCAVCWAWSNCI